MPEHLMPDILQDQAWLAAALWSYELDEPHANVPGRREGWQYYPSIDTIKLVATLKEEHSGDCTHEAHACLRCQAEHVWHKAGWLIEASKGVWHTYPPSKNPR